MIDIRPYITQLPAGRIADELNLMLESHDIVVVTAEPGAGKSTLLPLTMCLGLNVDGNANVDDTPSDSARGKRVLMLEPRRLAARGVAVRMSEMIGERVGETVGYRVRMESRVSSKTKVEVVTEGILTRRLIDCPSLEGVDIVVFDEFHERSLDADLALALLLECKTVMRPDLKIVFMSATINTDVLVSKLGAVVVICPGKMYPVSIEHIKYEIEPDELCNTIVTTIRTALEQYPGDILVFLPGQAEIQKIIENYSNFRSRGLTPWLKKCAKIVVLPLYGSLPLEKQKMAIMPASEGERKVVLATNIAETSLTIEGIKVVIDSGLYRKLVYDERTGLSHLETVRISRDMARQRAGRAGRVSAGHCIRLWSKATDERMAEMRQPEILEADLTGLILSVAVFEGNVNTMPDWLTEPPLYNIRCATALLKMLGAVDTKTGAVTKLGRRMADLPCHPRIAKMILESDDAALACDIAAVLDERDPMQNDNGGQTSCDLSLRISRLRHLRGAGNLGRWKRIADIAEQYRVIAHAKQEDHDPSPEEIGALVALAYPERVALRQDRVGNYRLSNGENVRIDASDVLCASEWLVVASLNTAGRGVGRIFLAATIRKSDLKRIATMQEVVQWDNNQGQVMAERRLRIGNLMVESHRLDDVSRQELTDAVCDAIPKYGLTMLDWNDKVEQLQRRLDKVREWNSEMPMPDTSTEHLMATASEWLPMYLEENCRIRQKLNELQKIDLCTVIWNMIPWELQQQIENIAPSHITVPTGHKIRLDYRIGQDAPVLSVRLQECFGMMDTPRVDNGRVPVLMELLSPGFKPVQLTSDLRNFWRETYFEVRKELRRRYPKHRWPENPEETK